MKNSKEYLEALNMAFDVAKKPSSKEHPTAAHIIFDAGIDFAMSQQKHKLDGAAQLGKVKRFVVSEPEAIEPTKSDHKQIESKDEYKESTFTAGKYNVINGIVYAACENIDDNRCLVCDLGIESCKLINVKCINTIMKRVDTKPLYEVGEIIELFYDYNWIDAEFRDSKDGHICVWTGDAYLCFDQSGIIRKKQKPSIYISGRITGLDYKEAFDKFEQVENELTVKGYEVVNPMKLVPFNKDWSWFDYMSADIKLMEKCTHIYMLSNWRESAGASVEHEISKWKNITIIYQ